MRIESIHTIPVSARIDESIMISSSMGSHRVSRVLVVRVLTDEGIEGLGEATVTAVWSGETSAGAKALIDSHLAPAIIGDDPMNAELVMRKLDRLSHANPFTKASIEMALLDIAGKKLGVPVCDLLGGRANDASIPVKFVVAATDPETAVTNATAMATSGFRTIKIKVGTDPAADIERVRRVREAVGPGVSITVDANGGWSVSDAVRSIRRMEPYEILLAEQPVARDDLDGMALVRGRVGVPIMADESVFTVRDALNVITREAADIISIYPGKNGGIRKAQTIARMAEAAGVACHIGSNLELEVGSAAMAHLAVSTANVRSGLYQADIIGPFYHTDRLTACRFRVGAGIARLPEGPGLGVVLDETRLSEMADA